MPNDTDDRLIHYLSDIYSIEQQALAQLRTAPDVAGQPTFARHLRDRLAASFDRALDAATVAVG